MKKFFSILTMLLVSLHITAQSQGWPAGYGGVMLQGFYWDSFDDSKWTILESQADELSPYFSLIWVPQSGKCLNPTSMGYDPYYYFNQNSSFGTAAELKRMIATFKAKGLGTIADVVINHHNTMGWWKFPEETYNGTTYQFKTTDIVANDDSQNTGYVTADQARKDGVTLGTHNDDGDDWPGMRDLDHKSDNVKTIVKAYEQFLLKEMGYVGFRYDMVKGFAGSHIAEYNDAAKVEYSIGECWDGLDRVKNWINSTSKKSAAFDFPFRYNVRDAIRDNNWSRLNSTQNLLHDTNYRHYSITFVENHDTEYRGANNSQDPIRSDTLAANAYMLAMPGTPCVFFKHWQTYKQDIKSMIDVRKAAGITNTSDYVFLVGNQMSHAVIQSTGHKKLIAVVGSTKEYTPDATQFTKVLQGYRYAYYLSNDAETAFIDRASGNYQNKVEVLLSAVSAQSDAKLVYTTDGSTPTTTHGTQVASGTKLTLTDDCTLTVGLLTGGVVKGLCKRAYKITSFNAHDIKIYVRADEAGTNWADAANGINYWTWGGDGSHGATNNNWPGDKVTQKETIDGKQWVVKTFRINSPTDYINFVFSVGTGSPQTVDVNNINKTTFITIDSATNAGGKHQIKTITTGIRSLTDSKSSNHHKWYNLRGQQVEKPLQPGIYIHNGKKIAI